MPEGLWFEILVVRGGEIKLRIDPGFIMGEPDALEIHGLLEQKFTPQEGFEVITNYVENGIKERAFT